MEILAFGDCMENGVYHLHSSFTNIVNYSNNDGNFISLTSNLSFLSSNSIVVNNHILGNYLSIEINTGVILLNNQIFNLNTDFIYNSDFEYPNISMSELLIKINHFITFNKSLIPSKSLFFLICTEYKKAFNSIFEKAYLQQMEFAFSIFYNDFFKSINEFKSRGLGLTPSGDDFIAGILFGIHLLEVLDNKNYDSIRDKIYEISKTNNLFSRNMLRLAYKKKYFKRFNDFLYNFFYLTLENNKNSLNQLLSVGHTSGADILAGFFTVLLHKPLIFNE